MKNKKLLGLLLAMVFCILAIPLAGFAIDTDEAQSETQVVETQTEEQPEEAAVDALEAQEASKEELSADTLEASLDSNTNYWKVGNNTYETFAQAQAAAGTGTTITLLSDVKLTAAIEVTKTGLTIDLDGHTINASDIKNTEDHRCAIYNGANELTVTSTKTDETDAIVKGKITGGNGVKTGEPGKETFNGGGIYNNSDCSLTLSNCEISGNSSSNGGGIYNDMGTLTVKECTISGNSSTVYGGGICNNAGTLTVTGCTISGNMATSSKGGGICNMVSGTLDATECTITGNSARAGGGINNAGTSSALTLDSCTISENTASFSTGGVFNAGTLIMKNTSVTKNTSPNAGGVYNQDGTLTITGGKISENVEEPKKTTDGGYGAGICNYIYSDGKLTTIGGGAIVYGNKAKNGEQETQSNILNYYKSGTIYPSISVSSTDPLTTGAKIGVDFNFIPSDKVVVKDVSEGDVQYFVCDNASYGLYYDENNLKCEEISCTIVLKDGKAHKDTASGDDITNLVASKGLTYKAATETEPATWTMNNFTFTTTAATALQFLDSGTEDAPANLTIMVEGTNTITSGDQTSGDTFGIDFTCQNANVTVAGTGATDVLNVTAGQTNSYNSKGCQTLSNCDLEFNNITANFTAKEASTGGNSFGVVVARTFTVGDGAEVTCVSSECANSGRGIYATATGKIAVEGTGKIYATSVNSGSGSGAVYSKRTVPDAKAVLTGSPTTELTWKDNTYKYEESTEVWKIATDVTLTAVKTDISACTVAAIDDQIYTGSALEPGLTVTYKVDESTTLTLEKDTDYEVTYSDNVNAGTGKATITGIGNYTGSREETFVIKPIQLTVTGTKADSRPYDSTKDATIRLGKVSGIVVGEEAVVSVKATGEFTDANAGENKTVNVTYSLEGTGADNYIAPEAEECTATIHPFPLAMVNPAVADKVYDGTTDAVVTNPGTFDYEEFIKEFAEDDVEIDTATAVFDQADAKEGIGVMISYTLKGADKDNYVVSDARTFATITPKTLHIQGTKVNSKVYDGTNAGEVGSKGYIIPWEPVFGDFVRIDNAQATFANVNAGWQKIKLTYTLSGKDAGNYTAVEAEPVWAEITKRQVTLTSDSQTKLYDGTALTSQKIDITGDGFVKGEGADFMVTGSQLDAGKSVNTFSYQLKDNTKAGNYDIEKVEGSLEVTKRQITITSASAEKVYDGQPLVKAEYAITGDGFAKYQVQPEPVLAAVEKPEINGDAVVEPIEIGEGIEVKVTGSQTEVGSSKNTITYTLNEYTKAENYDITLVEGDLTVTAAAGGNNGNNGSPGTGTNVNSMIPAALALIACAGALAVVMKKRNNA